MAFSFKSNVQAVSRAVKSASDAAMEDVKDLAIEAIQEKILYGYHEPHGADGHTEIVDTGHLFDHVDAEVRRQGDNVIRVTAGVSDTPYAVYVHEGTRKLHGRPFIKDAIQSSDFRAKMLNALRGRLGTIK